MKIISKDNLNRDYQPEALVAVNLSQDTANQIADLLNGPANTVFYKVVKDDYVLNTESMYECNGEDMPIDQWSKLQGINHLPESVQKFAYNTMYLKDN